MYEHPVYQLMRPLVLSAVCLALTGVLPASAQTYSYLFSSCASGVSMQITFPVTSTVGPVTTTAGAHSIIYTAIAATFSLTIGGSTQTVTGLAAASAGYAPAPAPGAPALTTVGFDPSSGQGGPPWYVNLQGGGDLLPNGLTPALPPLSLWVLPNASSDLAMHNDYITVSGKFYYIDSFSGCSASNSAIDLFKTLGIACDFPGCVACGEPINVGTGNVFEHVADYQTFGPNQLGFDRYYNSLAGSTTYAVRLGLNWRSTYDRYLRLSATPVIAERSDGQQVTFALSSGAWTPDTDRDYKLTNSGSTWTLTDSQDSLETYSAISPTEALLQSVRARNGYTQTLQYDSSNQLAAVTDSFNRQLSFAYSAGRLATVTTPDGLILTYGYTGNKLTSVSYSTTPITSQTYLYENSALPAALTGIVDENGNRFVTWTYDSMGRGLSSQFAGGADLTRIAYNDTDGSRTVTNALGAQTVYKFTTLQKSPKVTEINRTAAGSPAAVSKITYDSNGYTTTRTDWNGNLTTYANDVHGQPTTINEAVGAPQARTTSIAYHPTFHLALKVVTPGITTSYTYDSNGQVLTKALTDTTTTTAPYSTSGQTRTWTYTWSNSLLASVKTPRTDVNGLRSFTYDASGALTATTNALGQTIEVTQHLLGGLPQTIVDENRVSTSLAYDPRLRLLLSTVATAAGPRVTSFTYDGAGNPLSVTRPDGSTLSSAYDAAHRMTGLTDLFNQSVAYTLDAQGDRTQINLADPAGVQQRTHSSKFDALGRLQQDAGGAGQTTSYAYDSNGNALTVNDPLNHVTHRAFDALNRLIAVTDAAGGVSRTSYDAHDRPISVTDPNGGVTTYVYDGFGDVIQTVSPDSGTTVYRYDADGNLAQRVDGAGATVNYTYDALDRVKTASYTADAPENVSYTYDQGSFGIGKLTAVADAAGTLARSYDELGNLLSETRVNGAATLLTTYTYDAANRVASITYPSGWTVAYARDAMGRATAVTAQTPDGSATIPVLAGVGYQPFGPVNGLTFGNSVTETRSFDRDYRLTSLADAGTSTLQSLAYTYDADNNVSAIADGVTSASSQTFGYDALNRLTAATGGYGSLAYTYDSAGNRLTQSQSGSPTTYSYTAHSNQLASLSANGASQTVGYMKTGNVNSFNPAAGAISDLAYNQAGRLAAVMAAGNPVAQYAYDAFGHRLVKLAASTTLYQYDQSSHLLEEADGQGNPQVDYIYLGDQPVATLSPGSAQVYFLHDDRLGTPQAATDSNHNIVWTASYGPFGEISAIPGLIVQNLRMPGQEFDADSGLYHNGFRDYAPAWGRYLQSDPIGLAGGLNTYGYAEANPVNLTDPLGLDVWQSIKNAYDVYKAGEAPGGHGGFTALAYIEFPEVGKCVTALKNDYQELKDDLSKLRPLKAIYDLYQVLTGIESENPIQVGTGLKNLAQDTAPAPPPATPPPANPSATPPPARP